MLRPKLHAHSTLMTDDLFISPQPSLPLPVFKFTSASVAPTSRADPMAIEALQPKKPKFANIKVLPIPFPSQ